MYYVWEHPASVYITNAVLMCPQGQGNIHITLRCWIVKIQSKGCHCLCLCHGTIHITGTEVTQSVCADIHETNHKNSAQQNDGEVYILFWILRAFCCSLHSLPVINDKTPEPHWNDIEGIFLKDFKKGRIDRYHKPLCCYQDKKKKSCYKYIQLHIKIHKMTFAKRQTLLGNYGILCILLL